MKNYPFRDKGAVALVGDVWYTITGVREFKDGSLEYKLYSRRSWVKDCFVKDIKGRIELQ